MVYAAGDPGLAPLVRIHPDAIAVGIAALRAGMPVTGDVRMVVAGLDHERLVGFGCTVRCAIEAPGAEEGPRLGMTRSAAGMVALADGSSQGIVVIGNAPTALLALLDLVDAGRAAPALIIGTPVGFVAAAEAKAELEARRLPFVTVAGTRGGSAIAAAAFNAILRLAGDESIP
jgi:precorrin-8X/cobalt-precorrin-8 methylmutase